MVKAANALQDLVDDWRDVDEKVRRIEDIEHAGDEITHSIMADLHSTFFTPLDREDIAALAHSMDDVVDFIQAAGEAMQIYHIDEPTPSAKELALIIVQAASEIEKAMPNLRKRSQQRQLLLSCIEINRLENAADRVLRRVVGDLFTNSTDVINLIKWREIYEHMESATDRCEDVANVLEGVALKNA